MKNKKILTINYLIIFLLFFQLISQAQNKKTFIDNFENNQNNWQLINNQGTKSQIKNDKLIIRNKNENSMSAIWKTFYINQSKDFSIHTKIGQFGGKPYESFGIIWGATGWDNYYCLLITSSYYFKVYRVKNNKTKDFTDWSDTDATFPKYFFNEIEIQKIDNILNIYINHILVYSSKFTSLYGTQFAFLVSQRNKIKIDYLKINYTENKLNLCNSINFYAKKAINLKIDSLNSIIAPVIASDSKTLYFSSQGNINDSIISYDIFSSKKNEMGFWTNPYKLDPTINNSENNLPIYIFPDGQKIIYQTEKEQETILISPTEMQTEKYEPDTIIINDYQNKFSYASFCFSKDRKILISAVQRKDTHGSKDLYVSLLTEKGNYSTPLNLGNVINTYDEEGTPFLSADNKTLYFFSYGHPGFGNSDIFVSHRLDQTWTNWSEPQNLGEKINTPAAEAFFITDSEKKHAYFVSNYEGIEKIYKINISLQKK